jgi:hypothetical protein
VNDLLRVYGHKDVAALEEIDALYTASNVMQERRTRPRIAYAIGLKTNCVW